MAGSNLGGFSINGLVANFVQGVGNIANKVEQGLAAKAISAFGVGAGVGALALAAPWITERNTANSLYNSNVNTLYPSDLIVDNVGRNQTMTLFFYKYVRPSVTIAATTQPLGAITFPLPNDLIDKQTLKYDESSLSPALGAAINGYVQGNGTWNTIVNTAEGITTGAATQLDAKGLNSASNLGGGNNVAGKVYQVEGLAQNPFLTLLFQGNTFKRYVFKWVFSPDNQKDSDNLKFCLNKLRYHSLSDLAPWTQGTLLQMPDLILPYISPSTYTFDFKHCVIDNISVDIVPGNQPSFFNSGAPSAIALTLSLIEAEIWTKADIATTSPEGTNNYVIPSTLTRIT